MSGETLRCVDCGRTFDLSYDEQRFFKERGLDLPKRCKTCRSRRKRERDPGMRPEVGPQATPKPSPSAQQRWARASQSAQPATHRAETPKRSQQTRSWWTNPVYRHGVVTFGLAVMIAAVLWRYVLEPVGSWLIAINLITLLTYLYDKVIASSTWTRVPEKVLLALTFAGGTLGALVGRWLFRHKTIKGSFRLKFWLVVAAQVALVVLYYAVIMPWMG